MRPVVVVVDGDARREQTLFICHSLTCELSVTRGPAGVPHVRLFTLIEPRVLIDTL